MLRGHNRPTHDALLWEPIPNLNIISNGIRFQTNRWGMHDKDYSLARPTGTYRIALLGSSITVGGGVPADKTMESLLEAQLNREGPGTPSRKYEILNFSAAAYGVLQNVLVAERKVFAFNPNAIVVGIFSVEVGRMRTYLSKLVKSGYRFPDPYVENKLREAGVDSTMQDPELLRRLAPVSSDLVRWSYQRLIEIGRQRHVPVVGIIFPEPDPRYGRDINASAALAAAAGLPLVDLRGVYAGLNPDSLRLPGTDPHWNEAGNRLVFERTYQLLREHDAELLKLGFSSRPPR